MPLPTDFIYLIIYLISSPSHEKRNRRRPVRKDKVTSLPMKPQFSGSCIIKSRQLLWKDRFTGSGWKKKREKRSSRQSVKKSSPHKLLRYTKESGFKKKPSLEPHHFVKSSLATWKFRKKKPAHSRRFLLKESVSWKRRKKKSNLKFVCDLKSSSPLKESIAWKRRRKKDHHSERFLFDVFDWDPGNVSPFKLREFQLSFWPGVCGRAASPKEFNGNIIQH